MAGKGDRYRHVDPKKWEQGWEKCFGKEKTQEEKDELIEERMTNNMKSEDLND